MSTQSLTIALVGNPNSGKTTLFNALTGLRQKVGNYPGVTVEIKEGRVALPNGRDALLLDLPGLYSLIPDSLDEALSREVLLGRHADAPAPDLVLNIVDASNLERNLYLTSQLLDLGLPMVIALTMTDTAEQQGLRVDATALSQQLGVPVCGVIASKRQGMESLLTSLQNADNNSIPEQRWTLPASLQEPVTQLQQALEQTTEMGHRLAFAEATSLLMQEGGAGAERSLATPTRTLLHTLRRDLAHQNVDADGLLVTARYDWATEVAAQVLTREEIPPRKRWLTTERIDRVVMHPFWGYVLFFGLMLLMFQSIFTWAGPLMDGLQMGIDALGSGLARYLPEGDLRDLLLQGVLGGVGNTIIFLPQILILFFFVNLLEDSGYMARAADLMDRLMSKVGLHGKSFIPLLSSFACAIPGIMATRTINDRKARLITILIAPLMSCSARLPVYALMIGAFVPNRPVLKIGGITFLTLPGVTLMAMYFVGMIAAFGIAWLFHRTLLKGVPPHYRLEHPPYRLPNLKTVLVQMVERAWLFLARAGKVILPVSVLLWGLATYPKHPDLSPEQRTEQSFAGMAGHAIEPLIAPLGFDWKMGVGLISSFAAREVFVTAMGTVYNVDDPDSENGQVALTEKLRQDTDPRTGKPVYTPLVAIALMVYYVLAMQCMSTVAVVYRETNGWKWPLFQLAYMTLLAWGVTFVVYQGGMALGVGR